MNSDAENKPTLTESMSSSTEWKMIKNVIKTKFSNVKSKLNITSGGGQKQITERLIKIQIKSNQRI